LQGPIIKSPALKQREIAAASTVYGKVRVPSAHRKFGNSTNQPIGKVASPQKKSSILKESTAKLAGAERSRDAYKKVDVMRKDLHMIRSVDHRITQFGNFIKQVGHDYQRLQRRRESAVSDLQPDHESSQMPLQQSPGKQKLHESPSLATQLLGVH
jgi:hypothetical protein